MIQLFFTVIFSEMALIMILLFKTPIRKLVIMGLDRVKRGRGPVMVKTVGGTVFVVLLSSVYSMMKIQKRSIDAGASNPTDQVLMAKHLLEASLMGFSLFLALMIDRLHHYIRELRLRRKAMEAVKKQSRGFEDDGKNGSSEEMKALEVEVTKLRAKVKHLQSECETKTEEAKAAEANAMALRKQSEGFLLEYDRLLEDNQSLKSQLESIDPR
ncbi:B-cell receptor-associated protein 31-like [Telopea speciosissima]|uniref:B-cell receptor-associated protein 31-like n=1 Tax=Telopea speciosissima TaxID=54955 RepID=UPI001CC49331|nr:B-cell receptor-associated protein 31-like [Telopea speciosissima]